MIDGITILNSTIITAPYIWVIILTIGAGIMTIISFAIACDRYSCAWLLISLVILFSFISMAFLCGSNIPRFTYDTGKRQYQCTIEDTVSLTEIYDKYEIISKDGDLWVLEDK